MPEKTEADEIEELITEYRIAVADWATSAEDAGLAKMDRTEDALRDKIRSIISERDALRAAMQSHRKELR